MRISASVPGASTAVEAMARFCGETILPSPPPMVLAASRIFGSRPAPWAAVACRLANRAPVAAWAAPGDGPRQRAGPRPAQRSTDGPDEVIGQLRSGLGLILRGL